MFAYFLQPSKTRFSVIEYGSAPLTLVGLQQSSNPIEARDFIENIQKQSRPAEEGVFMVPALNLITETILIGEGVRSVGTKAIIIISDEESDDQSIIKNEMLEDIETEFEIDIFKVHQNELTSEKAEEVGEKLCGPITTTPPYTTGIN